METREIIVKELKLLKKSGFIISITDGPTMSFANGTGTIAVSAANNIPKIPSSIERVRKKMVINIGSKDSEDDILEKINVAKSTLEEYNKILEHSKSSPDLMDYIINNVFLD